MADGRRRGRTREREEVEDQKPRLSVSLPTSPPLSLSLPFSRPLSTYPLSLQNSFFSHIFHIILQIK